MRRKKKKRNSFISYSKFFFIKGLWGSLVAFQVWDLTTPVQIRAAPFRMEKQEKKFLRLNTGEKVKLSKGKVKHKDRGKVIPGFSEGIRLRNALKKLKPYKINYKKMSKE